MGRFVRYLIVLFIVGAFMAAVVGGFILIISGGDPIGFFQTALARVRLNSKADLLNQPFGANDTPIRFEVNSGDSPRIIGLNLYNVGLIVDDELFVDYVRVEGLDTELEAGIYFLNQTQTIPEIAQMLTDSNSSRIVFRIPEGTRLEEVADLIDESAYFDFSGADFLAVTGAGATMDPDFVAAVGLPPGASLEGFLFPDTYQLPPTVTPLMLREILTDTFLEHVTAQVIADANAQGLSMYQVVTLASIVEREAVWPDEHSLIASVYRNRLSIDMRLEADPTVQYALNGERGRWWPNITLADYRGVISPYNTYLNIGLPPGPIANPSLSAILAATYPAESSYFFFRARCDGSNYHDFATTYDEHLANGC